MSVQEILKDTTSNIVTAINKAISEIIQTASISDSAFSGVIFVFAWIFISLSFLWLLRRIFRFFLKESVGIAHDTLQIKKMWKRSKEIFPNKIFDPFDNMGLSRARISSSPATKLWSFFGTDRELMQGLRLKHWAARVALAIAIATTTAMAAFGSASFVRELCASSGASALTTLLAVSFGTLLYTSIIYAFDLSIVTAEKMSLARISWRFAFALFMSCVIGAQLNIDFHKEFLKARLEKTIDLRNMEEQIGILRTNLGEAEATKTESGKSLAALREREKSLSSPNTTGLKEFSTQRDSLLNDKAKLECMLKNEREYGNFSSCDPQSDFGLSLNKAPREAGPRGELDCAAKHKNTNACKIYIKIDQLRQDVERINLSIFQATDAKFQEESITKINEEIKEYEEKNRISNGSLNNLKYSIDEQQTRIANAKKRLEGSKTDLLREMIDTIRADFRGEGDGSSYWMLAMFATIVIIDLFAVIAKFITNSTLYEARLRGFEAAEIAKAETIGEMFSTKIISREREVIDIFKAWPSGRTDESESDRPHSAVTSWVRRLIDELEKRFRVKHQPSGTTAS
ncbi:hypothetical protein [Azospirillum argentinense]